MLLDSAEPATGVAGASRSGARAEVVGRAQASLDRWLDRFDRNSGTNSFKELSHVEFAKIPSQISKHSSRLNMKFVHYC